MRQQHILFPEGATKSARRPPVRARSVVVLQSTTGPSAIDHPVVGSARFSSLMVQDGEAYLPKRAQWHVLTQLVLSLPGVVPPGLAISSEGYIDVPLLAPTTPDDSNITGWTISPTLRLDQSGAGRVHLYLAELSGPKDVVTRDLRPDEWWRLVRALLSLQVWMAHLERALDDHSDVVRRQCLAAATSFTDS